MRARDASVTLPAFASARICFKREIDGRKGAHYADAHKRKSVFLYTQFNYPPPRQGAHLSQISMFEIGRG